MTCSAGSLLIDILQMFCKGKEPYDFAVLPELLYLAAVNEEALPGNPLNFINDGPFRILAQESHWIFLGKCVNLMFNFTFTHNPGTVAES